MKALFFGLGGVGQRHLRNLLQVMPDVELGAVRHRDRAFEIGYDLQPDYSVDIMEKYGIVRLDSIEKGVRWKPDFAVIASPTSAHVEQASAMVRAGIPVFMEKPISADEAGLNELVELAQSTGVSVMIGYMFRFHPGVRLFVDLVEKRELGSAKTVHVQLNSNMPSWHSYEKYDEFYAGRKDLGGGAVLSEIHEVDLLAGLFGQPDSVTALGGNLSSYTMDVEDTACALLGYTIEGGLMPVTLQMSFAQLPNTRTFTVYCEQGVLRWDAIKGVVTVDTGQPENSYEKDFSEFERNEMFVEEIRHFVRHVTEGEVLRNSLLSVDEGHRLALRIKDSIL